jgi:hypothetical protein
MFRLALTIIHANEFPFTVGLSYSQAAARGGAGVPRFLARAGGPLWTKML